ncbi:MAG: glycosyltransferase family 4 protein [Blastocatellia bacterium]
MKILFVAEQFVPPVYDGSSAVYEAWLRSLKEIGDLYPIFFTLKGTPSTETHSYLRRMCRDYLILPGHAPSPVLKTARALGRFVNASLFARSLIEEFGRRPIKTAISQFISRNEPDIALISKLECIHLLGLDLLAGLRIPKLIDLHDDYVMREKLEREILRDTLAEFPSLASYRHFRHPRLRHRLSRLDLASARQQECRLLDLFDRIMISSQEEYVAYSARDGLGDRCVHVPWPIEVEVRPVERAGAPEFDAGLIAAGNVFNLEGLAFLVREVMPLIRKRRPGFRLLLVGNIAEAFLISGLPTEGLVVAGEVKDLSEFYGRIKVCVVPLLNGTGVSLKTLEALGYGLPVVATRMGARGLGGQDLPNLHVADTAEAFAETVLSLLEGGADAAVATAANRSNGSSSDCLKRFVQICMVLGVGSPPRESATTSLTTMVAD